MSGERLTVRELSYKKKLDQLKVIMDELKANSLSIESINTLTDILSKEIYRLKVLLGKE